MTKSNFIVLLALGALATSNAFASRARLLVMGTGDPVGLLDGMSSSGSLYYDDQYNIFYNPSYANDFKNWGTIEKSNYAYRTVTTGTPATTTNVGTSAEGGFVANFMNFNVGLFMNRVEGVSPIFTQANNMRPIDVVIAGDMGVKWGVSATYGSFKVGDNNDQDLNLKAGVQVADFEPFAAFRVGAKDKTTAPGNDIKAQGWTVGTRYKFGEWMPYAAWRQDKADVAGTSTKSNAMGLGVARNAKLAENARLVYTTGFFRSTSAFAGGANGRNVIPVDFALEGDALTWLTLRAGLGYSLWDRTANNSNATTTTGRIGASIHAGKADFDWGMGTNTGTALTTTFGGEAGSLDAQALGISQNFFTAASMTYRW